MQTPENRQSKPQPQWDDFVLPVPGAPPDLEAYLIPFAAVVEWAQSDPTELDEMERSRAGRPVGPRARAMLLTSSTVLRALLGRRLGIPPNEIVIRRDPRPHLDPAHGPLHFSVSRGADTIAVVVAGRAIGVDVEVRQDRHQAAGLMQVIHPVERQRLRMLPASLRGQLATRAWTRKEAVLKAWGVGLKRDPGLDLTGFFGRRTVSSEGLEPVTVGTVRDGQFSLAVAWAARPAER